MLSHLKFRCHDTACYQIYPHASCRCLLQHLAYILHSEFTFCPFATIARWYPDCIPPVALWIYCRAVNLVFIHALWLGRTSRCRLSRGFLLDSSLACVLGIQGLILCRSRFCGSPWRVFSHEWGIEEVLVHLRGSEDGLVVAEGAPDFVDALFAWMVRNLDHRCVSARSISPTGLKRKFLGASQVPTSTWSLSRGVTGSCSQRLRSCQMWSWRISFGAFHPRYAHASTAFWFRLLPKEMVPLRKRNQAADPKGWRHAFLSQQKWFAAPNTKNQMAYTMKAQPCRGRSLG